MVSRFQTTIFEMLCLLPSKFSAFVRVAAQHKHTQVVSMYRKLKQEYKSKCTPQYGIRFGEIAIPFGRLLIFVCVREWEAEDNTSRWLQCMENGMTSIYHTHSPLSVAYRNILKSNKGIFSSFQRRQQRVTSTLNATVPAECKHTCRQGDGLLLYYLLQSDKYNCHMCSLPARTVNIYLQSRVLFIKFYFLFIRIKSYEFVYLMSDWIIV